MDNITYQRIGNGQDVVLLHGWASNCQIWQPLVDQLATRYRVTVIDLPGYGTNRDCVSTEDLSVLAEQLRPCIPEGSWVVGWSLGGLVAMQLASRYPALVSGLCLLASSPCFVAREGWSTAMDSDLMAAFQAGLETDAKATTQRFVALQCHGDKQAKPIRRVLRRSLLDNSVDPAVLAQGLRLLEQDQRILLQNLSLPIHFVLGEQDAIVPAGLIDQLFSFGSNVTAEVWSDCSHLPFLSDTPRTVDCITALLAATK